MTKNCLKINPDETQCFNADIYSSQHNLSLFNSKIFENTDSVAVHTEKRQTRVQRQHLPLKQPHVLTTTQGSGGNQTFPLPNISPTDIFAILFTGRTFLCVQSDVFFLAGGHFPAFNLMCFSRRRAFPFVQSDFPPAGGHFSTRGLL